ncbi:MAG: extracellular solute-binding protein [Oscillospiraceae bacterium]|nr:extracellular solute-binding protein [Oscillospiraceae bacterium]
MQFSSLLSAYERENPDIEIVYEIIPDASVSGYKAEDRENAIARLRTALMSGSGPDLYLLRTNYLISSNPDTLTDNLLTDIEGAMQNGVFCDLLPLFESVGMYVDDYIAPVMETGRQNGKQYIAPIRYDVQGVLTNNTTREIMGAAAFESADGMMDGLLAISEIQGAGSRTALNFVTGSNYLEYFCNPYFLSNPPIVDYGARIASIDTPMARKILSAGKTAQENIGDLVTLASANSSMTLEEWKNYAQSEKYFVVCGDLRALANEAAISEHIGVTPNLDAFPDQDGGVSAIITLYTGIRSNSANKLNAVNLIKMLLSEQYQTIPGNVDWTNGWPVRKEALAGRLAEYVAPGEIIHSMYFMNETYAVPLSDKTVDSFLAIEARVTDARFPPPLEAAAIINQYLSGEIDIDATVENTQAYWDMSLKE